MENKKHKTRIRSYVIWTLIIIFAILFVVSYKCFAGLSAIQEYDNIKINETSKIDYTVCLNENDFIEEECVSEKRSFIASLINKINISLNYTMQSSKDVLYTYDYKIVADTIATERGEPDKILYTSSEVILEGEEKLNNSIININKKMSFDYKKYNDIITNFKKSYVLALDSELNVKIYINVKAHKDGFTSDVVDSITSEISIPLAEQTVNIGLKNDSIKNTYTMNEQIKTDNSKKVICFVVLGIDLLYMVIVIIMVSYTLPKKLAFEKKLDKILKDYDNIIVTTTEMPDISGLNKIKLAEFDELLDARENLNKPIIHYRGENDKYSMFIIIDDSEVYVYMLFANLINKEK